MIQPVKSYRKQVRGGWDNEENPFMLALSEPLGVKVMRKMETTSVFEFEPEERLWLIKLLSDIVMCQSDGRQVSRLKFLPLLNSIFNVLNIGTMCHLSEEYPKDKYSVNW